MTKYTFLGAALAFGLATSVFGSTVVTYSAAGADTTSVSDATVFSFDSLASGPNQNVVAGSIGQFDVVSSHTADQYGGVNGSHYAVVGGPANGIQTSTLTFNNTASYFGFWWSAADASNTFTLYNGSDAVLTLTNGSLVNALGACGAGNAYCGNPSNGMDPNELFVYVNIQGTDGTRFTSASFSNSSNSGFEFDNIAYVDPIDPAPEPATWAFAGIGLIAVLFGAKRFRRAQ